MIEKLIAQEQQMVRDAQQDTVKAQEALVNPFTELNRLEMLNSLKQMVSDGKTVNEWRK